MKESYFTVRLDLTRRTKQYLNLAMISLLASLLGACQLTAPVSNNSTEYSQYYLSLKSLEKNEILLEETKQKALIKTQLEEQGLNQGKLILIYSLPNTPLHNPYKAKRLLNEHLLANNQMSKGNLAFTMLLKDQLNVQLNLLSSQEKSKHYFDKTSKENKRRIEELTGQLDHVNNQLLLLKQIDQNINDRD